MSSRRFPNCGRRPFSRCRRHAAHLAALAMAVAWLSACQPSRATAQTLYWSGTSGTSAADDRWSTLLAWSTTASVWSAPAVIPSASTSVVFNYDPLTSAQTVYLSGDQTALGLTFSSPAATTLRGGDGTTPAVNTLSLGTGGILVSGAGAVATIGSGLADDVAVRLAASQSWNVYGGRRLDVFGGVAGSATTGMSHTLTVPGAGLTTLAGVVTDGTGGGVLNLFKTGIGALRLSNPANAYSGTTTVNQGSLVISANAIGAGTSSIVVADFGSRGMLILDGGQTPVTLPRNITLAGSSAESYNGYYTSQRPWFPSLLSVGDNAVSGTVGAASSPIIASTFGKLSLAGGLDVGGSPVYLDHRSGVGQSAITGVLSGTGTLEKRGAGTLELAASASGNFSGIVRVNGGSVRITQDGSLGTRTASGASSVLNLRGGLLEVRMDAPVLTAGGSAANVYAQGGRLFLDRGVSGTGFGQSLQFGAVRLSAASNSLISDARERVTLDVSSRNGYGLTFGRVDASLDLKQANATRTCTAISA